MERTAHDPIREHLANPSKIKAFRRFDSTFRIRFRVGAVMTASILLQNLSQHRLSEKGEN